MAKFLIFALVALPVCLAQSTEAEEDETLDQEDVESGLEYVFNLTPDDLKKECNVDFESAWPKIAAALEKLQEIANDFDIEGAEHFAEADSIFGQQVLDTCRKSEPFKNGRINVIKEALPCATEERVSELMKISEINTC